MKSKYLKFVSILFVSLFLINTTFADTNGIWHFAQDVVPGIFGADEDGANPLLNFTFISRVFFQATVDLGTNTSYRGQELDARYVNSNGDTMSGNLAVNGKITTSATVTDNNQLTTKSYVDTRVAASGSNMPVSDGAGNYFTQGGNPWYCQKFTVTSEGYKSTTYINDIGMYLTSRPCAGGSFCKNGACQSFYTISTPGVNFGCGDDFTAKKICSDHGKTYHSGMYKCQIMSASCPGVDYKVWWTGSSWQSQDLTYCSSFNTIVEIYCDP